MSTPFRFGVQTGELPAETWKGWAHDVESFGYSTVFFPDHFGSQWEPIAAQAAVAAVTERLNVGSLVYGVDYRHPVVLAMAAATLQRLSGGRHEFGLGAGWMESDYLQAGLRYDRPGMRISRLDEALQIVRSLWENDTTSFAGDHYVVTEAERVGGLPDGVPPKILIGGGGPKVLSLAGRHADIAGLVPSLAEGRVTPQTAADLSPSKVREKVRWVREAAEGAGRDPESLELSTLSFVLAVTDDPAPIRQGIAAGTGMTEGEVADCPMFLVGSGQELRERLQTQREETGISYVVVQAMAGLAALEQFAAEVVQPLAGT